MPDLAADLKTLLEKYRPANSKPAQPLAANPSVVPTNPAAVPQKPPRVVPPGFEGYDLPDNFDPSQFLPPPPKRENVPQKPFVRPEPPTFPPFMKPANQPPVAFQPFRGPTSAFKPPVFPQFPARNA